MTGHPAKEDYEYTRHGTANLFVVVEPLAVTERRAIPDFAARMEHLCDVLYPDAVVIRVVLDNLNARAFGSLFVTYPPDEAWRRRKLEFHYTPRHASWLNMAECELSVLARQCLDRRIDSREKLATEVRPRGPRRRLRRARAGGTRDHVLALKLAAQAEPRLTLLAVRPAQVASASDDRGGDLPRPAPAKVQCPPLRSGRLDAVPELPTAGQRAAAPLAGGTALHTVAGVVPVRALVERRRVAVSNARAMSGKNVPVDSETVRLAAVRREPNGELSVELSVAADAPHGSRWAQRLIVEDMWGNRLSHNGHGRSSGRAFQWLRAEYPAPRGWLNTFSPNLVLEEWVMVEHDLKFEFGDVPLP